MLSTHYLLSDLKESSNKIDFY